MLQHVYSVYEHPDSCCRWASLGAFYPFSRNHYAYFTRSHEYYQWPDVAAAAKKAYSLRYQLLSYIYSGFFLAHVKGGTVARPLLFTDPSDVDARCVWGQHCIAQFVCSDLSAGAVLLLGSVPRVAGHLQAHVLWFRCTTLA